ncbi:hypothetical protein, partial [Priestia megaterium]|uniref:hypothetical protein n=1 Tax=Priestia megaterium TaxID=1404 RepID=UPI001F275912
VLNSIAVSSHADSCGPVGSAYDGFGDVYGKRCFTLLSSGVFRFRLFRVVFLRLHVQLDLSFHLMERWTTGGAKNHLGGGKSRLQQAFSLPLPSIIRAV